MRGLKARLARLEDLAVLIAGAFTERRSKTMSKIVAHIEGRGTYEEAFGMSEQEAKAEHDRILKSRKN